jgi:hypothetical protein
VEGRMNDPYLKVILTVIALELGWIACSSATAPVSAQPQVQPQPVIITGINLPANRAFLPVGLVGAYRQIPQELQRQIERVVVNVDTQRPLRVETVGPVKVEADRPLLVESVKYTPGQKPGE